MYEASLEDIINKSADQIGEELKQGAVAKLLGAGDFLPGIEGSLEALNQLEGFIVPPTNGTCI